MKPFVNQRPKKKVEHLNDTISGFLEQETATQYTQYVEKWKDALMSGEEMVEGIGTASICQSIYKALGNSQKVLVTLCIGQKYEVYAPLINLDKTPWCHEPKGIIKPSNKELTMEVQRWQKLFLESDGVAKGTQNKLA